MSSPDFVQHLWSKSFLPLASSTIPGHLTSAFSSSASLHTALKKDGARFAIADHIAGVQQKYRSKRFGIFAFEGFAVLLEALRVSPYAMGAFFCAAAVGNTYNLVCRQNLEEFIIHQRLDRTRLLEGIKALEQCGVLFYCAGSHCWYISSHYFCRSSRIRRGVCPQEVPASFCKGATEDYYRYIKINLYKAAVNWWFELFKEDVSIFNVLFSLSYFINLSGSLLVSPKSITRLLGLDEAAGAHCLWRLRQKGALKRAFGHKMRLNCDLVWRKEKRGSWFLRDKSQDITGLHQDRKKYKRLYRESRLESRQAVCSFRCGQFDALIQSVQGKKEGYRLPVFIASHMSREQKSKALVAAKPETWRNAMDGLHKLLRASFFIVRRTDPLTWVLARTRFHRLCGLKI